MRLGEVIDKIQEDRKTRATRKVWRRSYIQINKDGSLQFFDEEIEKNSHPFIINYSASLHDDWYILPEPQTFGEICYESFVGTREDFGSWKKLSLSIKGDYERAAQAVLAAATEREGADHA